MERAKFSPRAVLRQNLRGLMQAGRKDSFRREYPTTQGELHKKSGVAQATIGRILSPDGENARIETVNKLASAYNLQGWQLLVAGMDPTNPPVLQPMTQEEQAFYARIKALYSEVAKPR